DPGPDGPAHAGIAWLPVANRAGQELGLDRDAVSHLAWSGGEDRRSVPGGADALVSFLSDQIPREPRLSGSGNSRFPASAALVFCSMSFAQVLGSRLFSARLLSNNRLLPRRQSSGESQRDCGLGGTP